MHSVCYCEEFQDFRAGATNNVQISFFFICYALMNTCGENRSTPLTADPNKYATRNNMFKKSKLSSSDRNIMGKVCFFPPD